MAAYNWVTLNTDISYHPKTKVAAWAFYVNGDTIDKQIRAGVFKDFPPNVQAAEFQAINIGLWWLMTRAKHVNAVRINTDNLTVIRMMEDGLPREGCNAAMRYYINIKSKFAHIKPTHVEAHVAISDARTWVNNQMDKLAKATRVAEEKRRENSEKGQFKKTKK